MHALPFFLLDTLSSHRHELLQCFGAVQGIERSCEASPSMHGPLDRGHDPLRNLAEALTVPTRIAQACERPS